MENSSVRWTVNWRFLFRLVVKTVLMFAACNLIFALTYPIELLGRLSLYNTVIPGRVRLPYGENARESYSLSLDNISAMFASHMISAPKADDEFRVVLLGDSAAWGWLLPPDETLAAQLNEQIPAGEGRRVVVYNLGYPERSLTKDLLLLDEAMRYQPDLIVWLVTLESFARDGQVVTLVSQNAPRIQALSDTYGLTLSLDERPFVLVDRTLVANRRPLADWLRLQTYGFAWWATGIDQAIPADYTPRATDLSDSLSWHEFENPVELSQDDLAFEVLMAGVKRADEVPVLLINEPIYVSDGVNSDLRYNSWYPRWAYDDYRDMLQDVAEAQPLTYLDLWDAILPELFTDSPVHLDADGTGQLAALLAPYIEPIVNEE